jgi:hypothetical protein
LPGRGARLEKEDDRSISLLVGRMDAYHPRQPSGEKLIPPLPGNEDVKLQMYQAPNPISTVTVPSGPNPRYAILPSHVKLADAVAPIVSARKAAIALVQARDVRGLLCITGSMLSSLLLNNNFHPLWIARSNVIFNPFYCRI